MPEWWADLQGEQPVVLVTQGTVATQLGDLLEPTLQALAEEAVLVIGTTGGADPDDLPFALPANARVERFIPFAQLLPHVDVMITNGGFNGVQLALSNGVPLIAAGRTEDKPEICARNDASRRKQRGIQTSSVTETYAASGGESTRDQIEGFLLAQFA